MASITFSSVLLIVIVTIVTVSCAPILTQQEDIAEFSNSNKGNVFLPFRELPERLIDDFDSKELDDGRDLPSESDIFYFFGKTPVLSQGTNSRKRGGF